MKKMEIGLLGLMLLSFVMKFLHLNGSGFFIMLLLCLLSMFYLYLGFAIFNGVGFRKLFGKDAYKSISQNRIIGAIGAGIALSISIIGILFKFQSWPGASINLIFGLFSLIVVFVISVIKLKNNKDGFYLNILKRVVLFSLLCAFLIFLPVKIWLECQYPNNPEYVEAVLNAKANPNNEKLWDIVYVEREKMNK